MPAIEDDADRRLSNKLLKVVVYTPFVTVPALPPIETVDVEIHVGMPSLHPSSCPPVPCVVVASAPVPFPYSNEFACTFAHPVPPFDAGRTPVISEARLIKPDDTTPAVALRNPVSVPIVMFGAVSVPFDAIEVVPVTPKNAVLDERTVDEAPPPRVVSPLAPSNKNPSTPVLPKRTVVDA